MTQVDVRSVASGDATRPALHQLFIVRLIVSSASSLAGLISFVLTGPVMYQVAAIDPALEALYLALVVAWFWSLARMWSLTCEARNRR
jgi:hypothetical protein